MLYGRLDDLRDQSSKRLAGALRQTGGTHQMRSERDTSVAMYSDQLAQYSAVENGLCFGRLDFHTDERFYIGRIGLFDEDKEYDLRPWLESGRLRWIAPGDDSLELRTGADGCPYLDLPGERRRRYLQDGKTWFA